MASNNTFGNIKVVDLLSLFSLGLPGSDPFIFILQKQVRLTKTRNIVFSFLLNDDIVV